MLFAIVIICNWLPGAGKLPLLMRSIDQYSLVNMIFIYILARLTRITFVTPIKKRILILGPVLFIFTICVIGIAKTLLSMHRGIAMNPSDWTWLTYYNAPHVWVMAISMLLFFVWHVHLPNRIGRFFAWCAPSMFGIYLLHEGCGYGRYIFKPIQASVHSATGMHPSICILMSAIFVFIMALVVDLMRRGCVFCLYRCIDAWRKYGAD